MPTPPDSTKSSLEQRLSAHARERWPNIELAVRHRAGFAYADAHLPTGETLPSCGCATAARPPTGESPCTAPAPVNTKTRFWFTGTPVEALDFAGGVLLIAADV